MTAVDENDERLADLLAMPAAARGDTARAILASIAPSDAGRLRRALRAHWTAPITDDDEFVFRDSLDAALLVYQYVDLAVACGYLRLTETTTRTIVQGLLPLIGNDPLQQFLRHYDYDDVERLGCRLGLLPTSAIVDAMPRDADCPMRFATFLDLLLTHEETRVVGAFLHRIDDCAYKSERYDDQWEFLRSGDVRLESEHLRKRLLARAVGQATFVVDYGAFFEPLDDVERRIFAMPIRYWLCKLFGYDRDDDGRWVQDARLSWVGDDVVGDWAFEGPWRGYVTREGYAKALRVLERVLSLAIASSTVPDPGSASDAHTAQPVAPR